MDTYQGRCEYCGNIQPVMAMDQIDANKKISEECSCGGTVLERRKNALLKNIEKVIGKEAPNYGLAQVTEEQKELVTNLALATLFGKIEAATVKMDNLKVSISGAEKVKIKRTDTRNEQLEA